MSAATTATTNDSALHNDKRRKVSTVSDMMSEIGLAQYAEKYAEKLMKKGYDDLQFLQMKANLDDFAAICHKQLKIPHGHLEKLLLHLRAFREPPAPLKTTVVELPVSSVAEAGSVESSLSSSTEQSLPEPDLSDDPLGLEKVLDRHPYDETPTICGNTMRPFQQQVVMAIKRLDPLPKKTICIYDDLGQLGKSDLADLMMQKFDAILFEKADEKEVFPAIRAKFDQECEGFCKWRVIIFNLTRESPLYDSVEFTQLLEKITDGSFMKAGWDGEYPWVIVLGNRPIMYTATTAANGGRIVFLKLDSIDHKLVFDRHLDLKIQSLAATAQNISTITDESAKSGKNPKVIAFEKTFEPSGPKGRQSASMVYTQLIDQLIDMYPTLFKEYRAFGKKPKVGGEDYVYQKQKFHEQFMVANFKNIQFSCTQNYFSYYIKKKA